MSSDAPFGLTPSHNDRGGRVNIAAHWIRKGRHWIPGRERRLRPHCRSCGVSRQVSALSLTLVPSAGPPEPLRAFCQGVSVLGRVPARPQTQKPLSLFSTCLSACAHVHAHGRDRARGRRPGCRGGRIGLGRRLGLRSR